MESKEKEIRGNYVKQERQDGKDGRLPAVLPGQARGSTASPQRLKTRTHIAATPSNGCIDTFLGVSIQLFLKFLDTRKISCVLFTDTVHCLMNMSCQFAHICTCGRILFVRNCFSCYRPTSSYSTLVPFENQT